MGRKKFLFKIGQEVYCNFDGTVYKGVVKEIFEDHIIVDVPEVSSHCWYEEGFNMDYLFLDFNEALASATKEATLFDYYEYANEIDGYVVM